MGGDAGGAEPKDLAATMAADGERIRAVLDSVTPAVRKQLLDAVEAIEGLMADELGEWVSEKGTFPWFRYSTEVNEFRQALYDAGLVVPFDWPAWMETLETPRLPIDDPVVAVRSITAIVRGDRFSEGSLLRHLESGELTAAVRVALGA